MKQFWPLLIEARAAALPHCQHLNTHIQYKQAVGDSSGEECDKKKGIRKPIGNG